MINIPTLIFFVSVYLAYRYVIKPYMIDAPPMPKKKKKKEDDAGEWVDYEEVDE